MRIISKFHDYYDIGMGHGQDRTVTFPRETQEMVFDEKRFPGHDLGLYNKAYEHRGGRRAIQRIVPSITSNLDVEPFVIFLAGNFYYGIKIDFGKSPLYVYDINRLVELNDKLQLKLFDRYASPKDYEAFFDFPRTHPISSDAAIRNMVAITYFIGPRWHSHQSFQINPCLRELDFFKVIDAYTAFQELSMWISGVLTSSKEVTEIPDRYKIAQHGFDNWSFRKLPQNELS